MTREWWAEHPNLTGIVVGLVGSFVLAAIILAALRSCVDYPVTL